jgi:hypothetical protein
MLRIILLSFFTIATLQAQEKHFDSIPNKENGPKFKFKQLIIPTVLIGYGVIGIESDYLKFLNSGIREEVTEDIDHKITVDDFSQYLPMASVYGLNAIGIKGKHNLKDRTIIIGTSYLIMSTSVFSLKRITT